MYCARISLWLFAASCLVAQALPAEERADESQAYQNIDAYLGKLMTESCSSELDFMRQTEQHLAKALEAVEIIEAVPDKSQFDEPDLGELTKKKVTIKSLQPVLHNLLLASTSCDQKHIDFLNVLARYITRKGQLLNEYAGSRINECWRDHVGSVSKMVARKLYKDSSSVFDIIDQLASTAARIEQRTRVTPIRIDSNREYQGKPPSTGQLSDMLKLFDSLKSVQDSKLHFLKRSLDSMFLATLGSQDIEDVYGNDLAAIKRAKRDLIQFNLIEPCKSVIGRFKQLESFASDYFEPSLLKVRFEDILSERARSDEELGRVLVYLQLCKRAVSDKGTKSLMSSV